MFSRKKEDKLQTKAPAASNAKRNRRGYTGQIGLLDVPDLADLGNLDSDNMSGEDDDDDLEAELMALQAGKDVRKVISRHRLAKSVEQNEFGSEEDEDENDADLNSYEDELQELTKSEEVVVTPPPVPPRSHSLLPTTASHPTPPTAAVCVQQATTLPNVQPPLQQTIFQNTATQPSQTSSSLSEILQERIDMYKSAQTNAKESGDIAKSRRLERGLKTLESMFKMVKAGRSINEEDIPLPVAIGSKRAAETIEKSDENHSDISALSNSSPEELPVIEAITKSPSPPPLPPRTQAAPIPILVQPTKPCLDTPSLEDNAKIRANMQLLQTRRNQYRQAAIAAKNANDREKTIECVKVVKQFDIVIAALEAGKEVDLSDMPPSPPTIIRNVPSQSDTASNKSQIIPTISPSKLEELVVSNEIATEESDMSYAAPLPTSVLDALQQRLQKYQSAMEEAKTSDNASKARRMGRIVKQYEDAIKAHKAGKPIDFDELPTPPGFPPIPVGGVTNDTIRQQKSEVVVPHVPTTMPTPPTVTPQQNLRATENILSPSQQPVTATLKSPAGTVAKSTQRSPQALHEKQHATLVERQRLFKVAALEAKRRGDIQAAKEYLKLAKGFDPMIKASLCGLPVNMDSMPMPPQLQSQEDNFELIGHEDCEPTGDRDELFQKLDKDLLAQIEMCAYTRKHFSEIGDVQSKKKFETLLLDTKKDLDFIRHANKGGYPVPRFHYETKTFSIVKCFTDLGDDDLELSIIRGINYACPNPNDVDTYVRFEIPYPPETHQKDKTHTVRNSNNPEYNAVFKLNMNRKARTLTRVVKRQAIKLEVLAKGGFLKSDNLLGTVTVKLAPLETRCLIHDSFDLMDGRKPVGGKLEIQLRVRDPILNKQVETLCEKWLIVSGTQTTRI